jgi:hypothetical protein
MRRIAMPVSRIIPGRGLKIGIGFAHHNDDDTGHDNKDCRCNHGLVFNRYILCNAVIRIFAALLT